MTEFEKIESQLNIWLPEKAGDTLEGTVVEKRDGSYGAQWKIHPADNSEEIWTPSHKVLQNRMNEVAIGKLVRIVKGETLPPKVRGHHPTALYDVYVAKE